MTVAVTVNQHLSSPLYQYILSRPRYRPFSFLQPEPTIKTIKKNDFCAVHTFVFGGSIKEDHYISSEWNLKERWVLWLPYLVQLNFRRLPKQTVLRSVPYVFCFPQRNASFSFCIFWVDVRSVHYLPTSLFGFDIIDKVTNDWQTPRRRQFAFTWQHWGWWWWLSKKEYICIVGGAEKFREELRWICWLSSSSPEVLFSFHRFLLG